jgi:hypothetical protein
MTDQLVAHQIEVDPALGASSLGAAEQLAVESPGLVEISDLDGEMEGIHGRVSASTD